MPSSSPKISSSSEPATDATDVDNVEVLTGTNLPMVIELLFLRGNATLAELGEQAVTVGQTGVTKSGLVAGNHSDSACKAGCELSMTGKNKANHSNFPSEGVYDLSPMMFGSQRAIALKAS